MRRYLVLFCMLTAIGGFAHNAEDIYYDFDLNQDLSTVMINLTTKGAIDVLRMQNPDKYGDKTIFDFKLCETDLEVYFNTHLKLTSGTNTFSLHLLSYDLVSHDALLVFELVGTTKNYNNIVINNSAFTDVYRNAKNFMKVRCNEKMKQCITDLANTKQQLTFVLEKEKVSEHKETLLASSGGFNIGLLLVILLGVAWVVQSLFLGRK